MERVRKDEKVKWWYFIAVPAGLGTGIGVLIIAYLALDWIATHITRLIPPFHH